MRYSSRSAFTLIELFFIPMILLAIAGWISNIVQIVHIVNDPITGMFVFKCIGVVLVPLGSVLGIVGWF